MQARWRCNSEPATVQTGPSLGWTGAVSSADRSPDPMLLTFASFQPLCHSLSCLAGGRPAPPSDRGKSPTRRSWDVPLKRGLVPCRTWGSILDAQGYPKSNRLSSARARAMGPNGREWQEMAGKINFLRPTFSSGRKWQVSRPRTTIIGRKSQGSGRAMAGSLKFLLPLPLKRGSPTWLGAASLAKDPLLERPLKPTRGPASALLSRPRTTKSAGGNRASPAPVEILGHCQ